MREPHWPEFENAAEAAVVKLDLTIDKEKVNVAQDEGESDAYNHQLDELHTTPPEGLPQDLVLHEATECAHDNRDDQDDRERQSEKAPCYPGDDSTEGDCFAVRKVTDSGSSEDEGQPDRR